MSNKKFNARHGVSVGTTPVDVIDDTGAVLTNAATATKLLNSRTISISGDVVATGSFDGSGNLDLSATIQANSVALGTDTTGNYMVNVSAGTGVSVSHTPGEGSTATVSIGQAVATTSNVTFNNLTLAGELRGPATFTIDPAAVGDNTGKVVIKGDLQVDGTTTTINSTTLTVDDLVLTLGGDTAPTSDDTYDKGIEYRWYDTQARVGFFGFDRSTGKLTFIPQSTLSSGVYSGTTGEIDAKLDWSNVLNKPTIDNTTYNQLAVTTTGGALLRLNSSGAVNDDVKFASGSNVTVAYTDDNTITISSSYTDTNTTYSVKASAQTGGASLDLDAGGSGSGTDKVTFLGSGGTTVARTDADNITISSTSVGDGALTVASKSAGATNTDVTLQLSGAYSANTSTDRTIKAVVGPALTALATIMTGAGSGFLKKSGEDTYSVDTSTYLTSYTETDTLDSVTTRGASTSNAITLGGGLNFNAAAINYITTSTDSDIWFSTRNTSTTFSGAINIFTGYASGANKTAGNVTIYAGQSASSNGARVDITGGDVTSTMGIGGNVIIRGGNAQSAATQGTGGSVYLAGGYGNASSGSKTGGSIYLDGGAPYGGGTNTNGNVYLGTSPGNIGNTGTAAVYVGSSGITTTISGTVKLPNVGTSGFVKLGAGGQLSADTSTYFPYSSTSTKTNLTYQTWYTIATLASSANVGGARFIIKNESAYSSEVVFYASNGGYGEITVIHQNQAQLSGPINKIRIKPKQSGGWELQVYINVTTSTLTAYMVDNIRSTPWVISDWTADGTGTSTVLAQVDLSQTGGSGIITTGKMRSGDGSSSTATYEVWNAGTLTNLNQLTNGPGYITSYSETDTLSTVTARGATTSTASTFSGGLTVGGTGVVYNGSTSGSTTLKAATAAGSTTITMPATSGTMALTSDITTVNTGTLTLSIGSAAATNNTVTVSTGTGFNANSSGSTTYQLSIGPALTALATLMTTAGAGFIKRGATADTYTIDTNTYLTSYTETDTLDTVVVRGSSTTTNVTLSGGTTTLGHGTLNTITTSSNGIALTLSTKNSTTASGAGGQINIKAGTGGSSGYGGNVVINSGDGGTGNAQGGYINVISGAGTGTGTGGSFIARSGAGGATAASGTATFQSGAGGSTSGDSGIVTLSSGSTSSGNTGNVNILAGAATIGIGGNINITGGDTNSSTRGGDVTVAGGPASTSTSGTAGYLTLRGGISNSTTTSGSGGTVYLSGGSVSTTNAITKNGGHVYIDGGGAGANGTINYGNVYIGNQANGTTYGTANVYIGKGTGTAVYIKPTTVAAGFLKIDANGLVSSDTSTYLTSYTETSTLSAVTGRGATTATVTSFTGGGGDGLPALRITQTAGASASNWATSFMNSAINTSGRTNLMLIGQAESTSNSGYIGFNFQGTGSINNMMTIGLYASDHLLTVRSNGNTNIGNGTSDYGYKLGVGGTIYANSNYTIKAVSSAGYYFWENTSTYGIRMGNDAEFHYGPVTDYSIKTQIDSNGSTRGFVWGVNGSTPVAALNVGNGNMQIAGTFSAASKSFLIPHPTKEGWKLRYGSLEGPENGVYIRGKLKGKNKIELPEYWTKLVDPDSITVTLTPIGKHQKLYVEDIDNNVVTVGNDGLFAREINCFFVVYGERVDIDKLVVEYE